MKVTEFLKEDDHEASMAKAELLQIAKNAMAVYKMFDEGDDLPGWVSSYVSVANDHMNSVHEHMVYNNLKKNERPEPTMAETASSGGTSSGSVATSMGGGAGFGRSIFMSRQQPKKKDKKK
jgi:hypothetical protein